MAENSSPDPLSHITVNAANTTPVVGRRKIRFACVPCKERKRKCDGKFPCSTCLRYEYQCRYNVNSAKAPITRQGNVDEPIDRAASTGTAVSTTVDTTDTIEGGDGSAGTSGNIRRDLHAFSIAEATSGEAFSHAVGVNHEVTQTSDTIAWNIAPLSLNSPDPQRTLSGPVSVPSLAAEQQTLDEIRNYHALVGRVYPIISLEMAVTLVRERYRLSAQGVHPLLDAILSALMAISYMFTGRHDHELCTLLTTNSKLCFDLCFEQEPTDLLIIARGVQTLLFRATGSAHACWMASCMTIHLMEAMPTVRSRMHQETMVSDEDRASVYWTSKLFHMWISFEFGRPHVLATSDITDDAGLAAIIQKHRTSVLGLLASTRIISPGSTTGHEQLEQSFDSIEAFDCSGNDALSLSRCILAMVTFRRRIIQYPPVTSTLKTRMIAIGREGLLSVERLLQISAPWWHLASVPLQFICLAILLNALTEVPFAIRILRSVATVYPTDRVKGTIAYAERILSAVYKQRLAECRLLEDMLGLQNNQINNSALASGTSVQDVLSETTGWNLPTTLDDLDWLMSSNTGVPNFDHNMTW